MAHAQRHLTRKAIAELSHERLVQPRPLPDAPGFFELEAGASTYRFHAHRHELEHWVIDAWSITRELDGTVVDLDVLDLVASLHAELGLPETLVATYLEELSSTLASAAWKRVHRKETVQDLLEADLPTIEAAMTEGHPAFVASNGRIGLGLEDYRAFAPETGSDVHLVWLAVRRDVAHLSLGEGLSEESLYAQELDAHVRAGFDERLESLGLDPRDYLLAPAHPWQWDHKLAITFAPEVARRDVVPLGPSPDAYRAQQSIRTFYNVDRPERHYVKTALSIQNMGFMRGLSPRYMRATPAINDWVHDLVEGDEVLRGYRFSILRERAAIGFTGGPYEQLAARTPYQKMFAALWRESPHDRVGPGERVATMASLLHHDASGRSLAAAMIAASGLDPADWLRRYLDAYLAPLAHCLWKHDLAFMPHGENLILVIRDHVVERVLMKDVGEEVVVMGDRPLPPDVERIRADVPVPLRRLSILTDVVDGFLRFLSADLVEEGVVEPGALWSVAADSLHALLAEHPELAEAAERDDLFAPEFEHSCLNRLQLRNTLEMVDLADQADSLLFAGTLVNPLAGHR
ncbi:MAG: IucA/IucC family siderophore biosynthesis protein [Actinomycetales bacterium]|nr:MAG: IucA/IucC family siderophore biosynthesis protein [Actinomycetales bacterium]